MNGFGGRCFSHIRFHLSEKVKLCWEGLGMEEGAGFSGEQGLTGKAVEVMKLLEHYVTCQDADCVDRSTPDRKS